jgi:hypothetical protein
MVLSDCLQLFLLKRSNLADPVQGAGWGQRLRGGVMSIATVAEQLVALNSKWRAEHQSSAAEQIGIYMTCVQDAPSSDPWSGDSRNTMHLTSQRPDLTYLVNITSQIIPDALPELIKPPSAYNTGTQHKGTWKQSTVMELQSRLM